MCGDKVALGQALCYVLPFSPVINIPPSSKHIHLTLMLHNIINWLHR